MWTWQEGRKTHWPLASGSYYGCWHARTFWDALNGRYHLEWAPRKSRQVCSLVWDFLSDNNKNFKGRRRALLTSSTGCPMPGNENITLVTAWGRQKGSVPTPPYRFGPLTEGVNTCHLLTAGKAWGRMEIRHFLPCHGSATDVLKGYVSLPQFWLPSMPLMAAIVWLEHTSLYEWTREEEQEGFFLGRFLL